MCIWHAARSAPTTPYSTKAGSVRSNRSAVGWAKKAANAPSSSAASPYENGTSAARGRKIFVYVIGGITHRRACSHAPDAYPCFITCKAMLDLIYYW
jgi:hypothetical protein